MSISLSKRLFAPESLDLVKILTDAGQFRWVRNVAKLYYICTILYRAWWHKGLGEKDFFPINARKLQKSIGTRFASDALVLLLDYGIIEKSNHYEVGRKSRGYRFSQAYRGTKFRAVEGVFLRRKEKPATTESLVNAATLEVRYLYENLLRVSLEASVEGFFKSFKPKSLRQDDVYRRSVEFIQLREWFFCEDSKTGRIFNNVTSLPKVIRPYLRYDGSPLTEVDVSNCQPFLLLSLYAGEAERADYQDAVVGGQFYELIDRHLDVPFGEAKRDKLKKQFLTFFFDRERQTENRIGVAFQKIFPVMFEKIAEMKRENYRNLAAVLQKLEAEIIVKGVVREFAQNTRIPLLTIHDSILTTQENVPRVKETMARHFSQRFGVVPKLKIKDADASLSNNAGERKEAPSKK